MRVHTKHIAPVTARGSNSLDLAVLRALQLSKQLTSRALFDATGLRQGRLSMPTLHKALPAWTATCLFYTSNTTDHCILLPSSITALCINAVTSIIACCLRSLWLLVLLPWLLQLLLFIAVIVVVCAHSARGAADSVPVCGSGCAAGAQGAPAAANAAVARVDTASAHTAARRGSTRTHTSRRGGCCTLGMSLEASRGNTSSSSTCQVTGGCWGC